MKMKPVSIIKADLGINPGGRVQMKFTDTCREHMKKYVPYSGDDNNVIHLRENTTMEIDSITYHAPYAHAMYVGIVNGYPVRNWTTPGTGPYWDKQMVSAEMSDVIREVQEYVTRGK